MPFVFLFLGSIMLVIGVRGTQREFGELVADLFTGPNNLTFWALAIISVGALGYARPLRGLSIAFMALILVSLIVGNREFFDKLVEQIRQGTQGFELRGSLSAPEFGQMNDDQLADYLGGGPFTW